MASQAPDHDFFVGSKLGHYRIVEKIGAGGMGEVYRATDEHLDRNVAIKVLPPKTFSDDSARKHFRKEALALSKQNHPNIATIHDFDTQQGIDFLVMEYVPGVTLSEKIANHALPEKEVTRLGLQLVEGLAAAHEQGVIHRDLKPNNLLLTPDGRLKILDFGLAKLAQPATPEAETDSETRTEAGTLPYMSPEQLHGDTVDARSDIWAAGTVLYEMATGQTAFHKKTATATADAILHKPVAPPGRLAHELSPQLEGIILKCLEKDADNRYQSARELLQDLRRAGRTGDAALAQSREERRTRWFALVIAAATLLLLAGAVIAFHFAGMRDRSRISPPHIQSLAVLPLENLSGDPGQEYFVDGMHEELIATLGTIRSLTVISRTSVMQYKQIREPLPKIAKELGVDAVVEGTVRRAGGQVRVTVQLIEGATDRTIWSGSYQREVRDTLALQGDVARAIAQGISVALTPEEEIRLGKTYRVNAEAHDAYLKGRYYWNRRTTADLDKAKALFQQAVEIDPGYALGYAGLADTYFVAAARDFMPPQDAYREAEAAARRALQLDDLLAEAHAAMGGVSASTQDWLNAEREYKRAIELNPSYATAHHRYGVYLAGMGRFDEARAEITRARELDPFSLIISEAVGWPYYLARQYDQAIEQYQRTLQMDANFLPTYHDLGRAYLYKGMFEEAIRVHLKLDQLSDGHPTARAELAHTLALAGKKSAALAILKELIQLSKRRYVSPYDIARIYVGVDEKNQALAWLDKAYKEQNRSLIDLKVDPDLDPVRSEPRFQELMRRMKFPN
jgi:serine/threonine protein kinase/Tfp pilus assembly protein PilF